MDDLISRQAAIDTAIDAADDWDGGCNKQREQIIRDALKALPSAQPERTECEEYDHERHFCPKYCDVIRKTVEEAKQQRTGRWIHETDSGAGMLKCSVCECRVVEWEYKIAVGTSGFRFCPYCGARMEGEG